MVFVVIVGIDVLMVFITADYECLNKHQVFAYFSSVRQDGDSFMTAGDLMRAIVPVFPPSGSHLVREGCLGGERSPGELKCPPSKFFMLFDTNRDGLISFPE